MSSCLCHFNQSRQCKKTKQNKKPHYVIDEGSGGSTTRQFDDVKLLTFAWTLRQMQWTKQKEKKAASG